MIVLTHTSKEDAIVLEALRNRLKKDLENLIGQTDEQTKNLRSAIISIENIASLDHDDPFSVPSNLDIKSSAKRTLRGLANATAFTETLEEYTFVLRLITVVANTELGRIQQDFEPEQLAE